MKIISVAFLLLRVISGSLAQDKGIGLLTIEGNNSSEFIIYSEADLSSNELARFKVDRSKGWSEYSVEGKNISENNLLEYDYEELGLPVCKIKSNKWIEVIYGYDNNNYILTGWVLVSEKSTLLKWNSFLKEKLVFFANPEKVNFFDDKNGKEVQFKLQPSEHMTYDYIMRPQVTKGNWMKVEVVTPSDYCDNPESLERKVFWIQYLDDTGRPLVWYFTRGC